MNRLRACFLVSALACALALPVSAQAAFPGQNGRIAYTHLANYPDYKQTIHTVDPSGNGDISVTTTDGAHNPAWSPDGVRLAFADTGGIYVSDQYGANRALLFAWSGAIDGFDWSPNGTRLAASLQTCDADDCHMDIYAIDLDANTATDLTPDFFDDRHPSWSPDGSTIVFWTARAGAIDIYSVAPDGSGLTNLTSDSARRAVEPDWSPDGQKIVFSDLGGGTFTMNAGGSGETSVPADRMAAWSPDGLQLASTYFNEIRRSYEDGSGFMGIAYPGKEPDWQPAPPQQEPPPTGSGYPRPKGATPFRVPLVVAFPECAANNWPIDQNSQHGAPLAFPSCAPATSWGEYNDGMTVGTPDANGLPANSIGYVQIDVLPGNPGTPADEAEAAIRVHESDVWSDGFHGPIDDYAGELLARLPLRITDRYSAGGSDASATVTDINFDVTLPCTPTAAPSGSTCDIATTADAVVTGAVKEGKRSIWQLGQVQVFDGGFDGTASTPTDNVLFATQGVFVP